MTRKNNLNIFTLCSLILAIVLGGCAAKESKKVSATVDKDFVNAYDAFEMAKNPRAKVTSGDTVSMSEGVWLGSKSTVLEHKNNLPSKFETDTGVTVLLNDPVTLQVLANNVNSITGIPVKIDSQINNEKLKKTVNIAYTGKLSGLLSQVATDLDLLWYYDKNSIVFYETETKTFTLYALGTDVSYQSSIKTGVLSYLWLSYIGLEFAGIWAFIIFVMNYIPTIGSIIACSLPILYSLITTNTMNMPILTAVGLISIQIMLGNIIEPKLTGKTLNLSTLAILINLVFWGIIWGFAGMFFSVPLLVATFIITAQFDSTRWIAILLSANGEIPDKKDE